MKKIIGSFISLFLFSSMALAVSHDEQTELDLQAAALVQVSQGQEAVQDRSFFGIDLANPFSFLDKLKEQIESVKSTLLTSFDENGNGKIDPGTETENFKAGIKSIAMLIGDTNQNGKIDAEDIGPLNLAVAVAQ